MIRSEPEPHVHREEVLERARTAKALPMLRGMMREVFGVIADPDSSLVHLYNLVKYDQAIPAKIISIANSAYYNRGTSVTNLERAMITVGLKEIKRIILCMVFLEGIMAPWKLKQADVAAIWKHSLIVAHAAKRLAEKIAVDDPEEAFTVSILHDVGKLIFYTFGNRYRETVKEASLGAHDICDLERAEYGIDHQEVGHHMSMAWGFPENFSKVILTHHSPHDGKASIVDVVRDADAFVCGREGSLPEREKTVLQNEEALIMAETERIIKLVGA
jgi:putative nucleotidyltransferase with HDIG domain